MAPVLREPVKNSVPDPTAMPSGVMPFGRSITSGKERPPAVAGRAMAMVAANTTSIVRWRLNVITSLISLPSRPSLGQGRFCGGRLLSSVIGPEATSGEVDVDGYHQATSSLAPWDLSARDPRADIPHRRISVRSNCAHSALGGDARNAHNVPLHRFAVASGQGLGLLQALEMVAVTLRPPSFRPIEEAEQLGEDDADQKRAKD